MARPYLIIHNNYTFIFCEFNLTYGSMGDLGFLGHVDKSWSFSEVDRRQTTYITHNYHRYPAKFIPQLVSRLIQENTGEDDLICDPFMGSGTTLVEALVNRRKSHGVDINPVAVLISRAKTTAIAPPALKEEVSYILRKIKSDIEYVHKGGTELPPDILINPIPVNKRIDYWFPSRQKTDLAIILSRIRSIECEIIQRFLLCSFSNILKQCSRWMMRSVKPTVDQHKTLPDAYRTFENQTKRMMIKNEELWKRIGGLDIECHIEEGDARNISLPNSSTAFIVTSPPYVTSYEYGDIHQLTAIWLDYTKDIAEFRTKFIGSNKRRRGNPKIHSQVGKSIVERLNMIDKRVAHGVEQYFFEMQECFQEMFRILKYGGRVSVVVGDTELRKVEIQNADFFTESMQLLGFKKLKLIHRIIPRKTLPLTRDEVTGRFVASAKANRFAYPTEHILIMEKI